MNLESESRKFYALFEKLLNDTKAKIQKVNNEIKALEEDIANARAKGDLSENAEFQIASASRDMKLSELRDLDKRLEELSASTKEYTSVGVVVLGSTVKLLLLDKSIATNSSYPTEFIMQLVTHNVADASLGLLAIDSIVGSQILGHVAGDIVEVNAPKGNIKYKIEGVF